ncbi:MULTISPECIES: hypothetical protein [unclassified Rhodococcus (in: high G+C Gram-positive bacteria)]|uniref:hypothetical protein n=1 Tax=unclassified Rhodococcus (in: high G+C Gram-positive bacteria) TaxID=192944 RepID=UPI0015C69653|nr:MULTISPECIES: hypothetical protein [unclassified Rhodococcus (in: high G+C Gram-positive bacteria)]
MTSPERNAADRDNDLAVAPHGRWPSGLTVSITWVDGDVELTVRLALSSVMTPENS